MSRAHDVPPLGVERADEPGGHRIRVTGELDVATNERLAEVLRDAIRTHERVIVDLAGVGFLDAGAVGTLVAAEADARGRGRVLVIDRAHGPVLRLLTLVGVLTRLQGLNSAG
ncbi:hypothetical protein Val02_60030 [Virgisporangium aliadipatigenens]|uniref:STAS domain-containing protein n=1 Tax=Virgisporangium aliadipatigenens TaxID=741659 RepID=A0A8J3YRE0_9ACTN|nr:STAS domain-containing protein [Virgisporangium aliadipatigenens]GIJ49117.1 hypothetical protein Val02_60030 [Virgisporangium aliadipatigenens]